MRVKINKTGSAYVFVLVITLLLFMIISVSLSVTMRNRQVTARYPYYASLYDLAAAGNERALFLMRAGLEKQREAIETRVNTQILQSTITAHLVYRNYAFHLAYPEDGYYAKLYQAYASETLLSILPEIFTPDGTGWRMDYTVTVNYATDGEDSTEDPDTGPSVTEVFTIGTAVEKQGEKYIVRTTVSKAVNGLASYPTLAEAEIVWSDIPAHEEIFVPAYQWANTPGHEIPAPFTVSLYAAGEISIPSPAGLPGASVTAGESLSAFVNPALLDTLSAYEDEPALVITHAPELDITDLYAHNPPGTPVLLIHTGAEPFRLYASAAATQFNGVLLCFGDLTLDGVGITGTAMADGDIFITGNPIFTPDANLLFRIPLTQRVQEQLFDGLGLTHFTEAGHGPVTDMAAVLDRVAFDWSGVNGQADTFKLNNFDGVSPAMVKLKKIAN